MKIQFKDQAFQHAAVQAIVDCFDGQPKKELAVYDTMIDKATNQLFSVSVGYKNEELHIDETLLLNNIQNVQTRHALPLSPTLKGTNFPKWTTKNESKTTSRKTKTAKQKEIADFLSDLNCPILDIEMETGTGKTYCYIKSIFELNKRYGWCKFIVVVPSIAIREGVRKSFEITADHFQERYENKARFFVYNSAQLHDLNSFSADTGINVMIINIQAFNAKGKDNLRIYEAQDMSNSEIPIDTVAATNPILILDEPQKMEGTKTLASLQHFNPLFVMRYSATHKTVHHKIYRIDALDAFNKQLVKKIKVEGTSVLGLSGFDAYVYLLKINISPNKPPTATIEMSRQNIDGSVKYITKTLTKESNLYELSNQLVAYENNFVVSDIDANTNTLTFANGVQLNVGQIIGDYTADSVHRIQIQKAIKEHVDNEQRLFHRGIKVLSLFFIDQVVKYRDYAQEDTKGIYARIFETEYREYIEQNKGSFSEEYRNYVSQILAESTHAGYFSIDKKSKRLVDSTIKKSGISDDTDAYNLILKDKERLLSLEEPVRFIFSHSALREGWDNPNVFVICTLKQSNNIISRRQEIGRGLRIAVDKNGNRMDDPAEVHDINLLTVIASETYDDFANNLQREFLESIDRPAKADVFYFNGKTLKNEDGETTTITL